MSDKDFECNSDNCPYEYECVGEDCEHYLECDVCYWRDDCYLPSFNSECSRLKGGF